MMHTCQNILSHMMPLYNIHLVLPILFYLKHPIKGTKIAMANFKFKIITKFLAYKLAQILLTIISKEKMLFIKNRQIKDCIPIIAKVINILFHKSHHGNFAIKLEITKAFDTIEWSFVIKVLMAFDFCQTLCDWISIIQQKYIQN